MEPRPKPTINQATIQQQQAWVKLTLRYLADLPEQIAALGRCLDQGDLESLQQLAHRAKGTSGTYRLASLSEHFSHLENLAVQGDVQDIPPLLTQLSALVAEATERCMK
jgi:HPt (histidine-containing phosphotransfer) domain-containing protein